MIYARLLGMPVVVVNSEITTDLLELRSMIYSDEPRSIVYEPFSPGQKETINSKLWLVSCNFKSCVPSIDINVKQSRIDQAL